MPVTHGRKRHNSGLSGGHLQHHNGDQLQLGAVMGHCGGGTHRGDSRCQHPLLSFAKPRATLQETAWRDPGQSDACEPECFAEKSPRSSFAAGMGKSQ